MSLIKNHLNDYKIFFVNVSNDLKAIILGILTKEGLKCENSLTIQDDASLQKAMAEIKPFSKKLALVNFAQNARGSYSFVIESRFGNQENVRDVKILALGSMDKNYETVNNLEGGIDGFISIPIIQHNLIQSFTNFCVDISRPSQYQTILELSHAIGREGRVDCSELLLGKAKIHHPRPSLAFYYLGKIQENKKAIEEAFKLYAQGLKFNKNHFMTLHALFNVLIAMKRTPDSMKVLTKMFTVFPPEIVVSSFIDNLPVVQKMEVINLIEPQIQEISTAENRTALKAAFSQSCASAANVFLTEKKEKEAASAFFFSLKHGAEALKELTQIKAKIIEAKLASFFQVLWELLPPTLKTNARVIEIEAEIKKAMSIEITNGEKK